MLQNTLMTKNKYYNIVFMLCIFMIIVTLFLKKDVHIANILSLLTIKRYQSRQIPPMTTIANISFKSPENVTRRRDLIIGIYVAMNSVNDDGEFAFAQSTLKCYAKLHGYRLQFDYSDRNVIANKKCPNVEFFFKRHCMASLALPQYDWMLFIDGDIGVVNPYRLIEEFIDDRVNIIFYDRLFNWEVMAGGYLVRNSLYSIDLLNEFANFFYKLPNGFHGSDNGAIHDFLVRKLTPHAVKKFRFCQKIWRNSKNIDDLFAYQACTRAILGENRIWPNAVKILDRRNGWARDAWITQGRWSPHDFMLHSWKTSTQGSSRWKTTLTAPLEMANCALGVVGVWQFDNNLLQSDKIIVGELASFEQNVIANFWNTLGSLAKYKTLV